MEVKSVEESAEAKLCLRKHDMAAVYYTHLSPTLSRLFMENCNTLKKNLSIKVCPPQLCCQHCHTLFDPQNHRVRFQPKKRPHNIEKIQRKVEKRGLSSLKKIERYLFDLYSQNQAFTVITCLVCSKKTKLERNGKRPKLANGSEQEKILKVQKTYQEKKKEKKRKKKWNEQEKKACSKVYLSNTTSLGSSASFQVETQEKMHMKVASGGQWQKLPAAKASTIANLVNQNTSTSTKSSRKSKSKKAQNVLQGMLAKAKKEKANEGSASLQNFLSSL